MNKTTIRNPQWKDLPEFLTLGRKLHEESWFGHISFDEDRVAGFFYNVMTDSSRSFCRVAECDNAVLGAVAGTKVQHWFSKEYAVFDTFLYVIPSKRGSTLAYRLWSTMRDWSASIGAKELTHGVGTAVSLENSHRFFTGIGMTHVGGIYKLKF